LKNSAPLCALSASALFWKQFELHGSGLAVSHSLSRFTTKLRSPEPTRRRIALNTGKQLMSHVAEIEPIANTQPIPMGSSPTQNQRFTK